MATMRESLTKLAEVAKPVPGDEQEFVAKHVVKTLDFQGKDSISTESPYDLIKKNVDYIKAPGEGKRAEDDHGHDAQGESEAAYSIPESREAKIAKLSEMMGNNHKDEDDEDDEDDDEEDDEDEDDDEEDDEDDEDDDEDDEDENKKKEVNEAKQVTGVKMHYHNPKTGEKFHEIHFTVGAAEKIRKQHEKSGFKLVKKEAQFSEDIEQVNELSPKTLQSYLDKRPHPKIRDIARPGGMTRDKAVNIILSRARAKQGIKAANPKPMTVPKQDSNPYYPRDPKDPHGIRPLYSYDEEMKPLLPGQKEVAKKVLDNEMQKRKEDRAAKKQAGTMKEEDRREANDKAREERVAIPRPTGPKTIEGMRHKLQNITKSQETSC